MGNIGSHNLDILYLN